MGRFGMVGSRWLAAVALLAASLVGCDRPSDPVVIVVDRPTALVDEPIDVRVSGLRPGAEAVVSAETEDWDGRRWRSEARFVVGGDGQIDLTRHAPKSGAYQGVDAMGLFSYLEPAGASADESWYEPPVSAGVEELTVSVAVDGTDVAHTSVRRVYRDRAVTGRELTVARDTLAGLLFLPPVGQPRRPSVLLLGGSEGGLGLWWEATLLASHGHPTLSLGYFNQPGLPSDLREIPLEYFAAGARRLAAEAAKAGGSGGTGPVAIIGYSRGAEAALLAAQHYPDLIRGAVLYAPNHRIESGFPHGGVAWVHNGHPLPFGSIAVDRVRGPVLAIAGIDDRIWPAAPSANVIMRAFDETNPRTPHESLLYAGSGHGVGTFPYRPVGVVGIHPVTGSSQDRGGTRPADEAARRDSWPKVLELLASLS
jgi:dienelactone hydrolase